MGFGDEIAGAVAYPVALTIGAVFLAGVFTGWLLFCGIPWPSVKLWLHLVTA